MLIAMMGNTYALVIQQSEKEFVKQWAKIVIALERAVTQSAAKEHLLSYSVKLSGGNDGSNGEEPSQEVRGVMVIKKKNKTRARQRKGALNNWKRVGKVTIKELKRRGITGDMLRKEIWEPETPTPMSRNISPLPIPIVSADPESSLMMMNFVDCIKEVPDVPIASNLSANKDVNQPPKAGCDMNQVSAALNQLTGDASATAFQSTWSDPVSKVDDHNNSSFQLSDTENELIAQTLLSVAIHDDSPAIRRQRSSLSQGPVILPKGPIEYNKQRKWDAVDHQEDWDRSSTKRKRTDDTAPKQINIFDQLSDSRQYLLSDDGRASGSILLPPIATMAAGSAKVRSRYIRRSNAVTPVVEPTNPAIFTFGATQIPSSVWQPPTPQMIVPPPQQPQQPQQKTDTKAVGGKALVAVRTYSTTSSGTDGDYCTLRRLVSRQRSFSSDTEAAVYHISGQLQEADRQRASVHRLQRPLTSTTSRIDRAKAHHFNVSPGVVNLNHFLQP